MENGNMMGFNGDLMVKIIGDLMLITKIAAGWLWFHGDLNSDE